MVTVRRDQSCRLLNWTDRLWGRFWVKVCSNGIQLLGRIKNL